MDVGFIFAAGRQGIDGRLLLKGVPLWNRAWEDAAQDEL